VAEWTLDLGFGTQINPCDNCANLTLGNRRVIRGGSWGDNAQSVATTDHRSDQPVNHSPLSGFPLRSDAIICDFRLKSSRFLPV